MGHIIDVLRGAKNQRVRQRRHDQLSTYGIGKDKTVDQWRLLGRTLLHQGLVEETTDGYPVLKLNALSWQVLRKQRSVQVAVPTPTVDSGLIGNETRRAEVEGLLQRLRSLRKHLADAQAVPPYIVFADSSLRLMAQQQPQTLADFAQISGVGKRKLEQYGERFTAEIRAYREEQGLPVRDKADDSAPTRARGPTTTLLSNTQAMTLHLYQQGLSAAEIAQHRKLKLSTITTHLAELIEQNQPIRVEDLVPEDRQTTIMGAIEQVGSYSLSLIREQLGDQYSYDEIKLVRASWNRDQS